jgi:hypothetical protein
MSDAAAAGRGRREAVVSASAILLVFHWILLGAILSGTWQSGNVAPERDPVSGHVSGHWNVQPFQVPRLQPRVASLETTLPESRDDSRTFGGKAVSPPIAAGFVPPVGGRRQAAPPAAVRIGSPNPFDARGPPTLS